MKWQCNVPLMPLKLTANCKRNVHKFIIKTKYFSLRQIQQHLIVISSKRQQTPKPLTHTHKHSHTDTFGQFHKWTQTDGRKPRGTPQFAFTSNTFGVFPWCVFKASRWQNVGPRWECVGAAIVCSNLSLSMWCDDLNLQFFSQKRSRNDTYK